MTTVALGTEQHRVRALCRAASMRSARDFASSQKASAKPEGRDRPLRLTPRQGNDPEERPSGTDDLDNDDEHDVDAAATTRRWDGSSRPAQTPQLVTDSSDLQR